MILILRQVEILIPCDITIMSRERLIHCDVNILREVRVTVCGINITSKSLIRCDINSSVATLSVGRTFGVEEEEESS